MTDIVIRPAGKNARRRTVGLLQLPPIAAALAEEQGIDPRTHGRHEHADFNKVWNQAVKQLRLLQRPSPEDAAIRADLEAAGLEVHAAVRSQPYPIDDTGYIVITDLA